MKKFIIRKLLFVLIISLSTLSSFNLAHALALEHSPYLQSGSTTSMTVRWRTDLISDTRLSYGISPTALVNVVENPMLNDEHSVTIEGLSPDTQYYYSVGSSSQVLAGGDQNHYFKTSPPAGTVKPVKIWAVGDSGTANASARAVRDAYLANAGTAHTDLFLMLGDNAYNNGTDSEYTRAVFDMYPTIMRQTPTWPTMGNHDARNSNVYLNVFTLPTDGRSGGLASGSELYYSYDYANIHFVVLDSQISSRSPSGAMLAWLEQDLAMTNQQWVIAYWHHPPYTKGSHDSDSESQLIDMRRNALPILESYGVDLVLGGHSHSYERSFLLNGHYGKSSSLTNVMKIDGGDGRESGDGAYQKTGDTSPGAVYVVAGSSGKISGVSRHPAMYVWLNQLGSMAIDVNDNRLDAKFINSNGNVQDSFTIVKGSLINQPPTVNAGLDQVAQTDANLNLAGVVNDDGLPNPPGTVSTTWRQISGPGIASFTNANDVNTTVGFIAEGIYTLELSANDGEFETSDTVIITVNPPLLNQPPVVNAGPDINAATMNNSIPLNGSVIDDGRPIPPAAVTTNWSTVSGPGNVNFSSANSVTSNAIFSAAGAYVLRLTASDGALSAQDDINVTVVASPINEPPVFTLDPINKPNATVGSAYQGGVANDASDPDGDALRFSKVSGPAWLKVAINGVLSGIPGAGDVGLKPFVVKVMDPSGLSDTATLNITVVAAAPGNRAPVFTLDPINKPNATAGSAYQGSLASDASDPDGDALRFSKVSGPVWLKVAINGVLSGTPGAGDVGLNPFVVKVMDPSGLSDTATLNITVSGSAKEAILERNTSGGNKMDVKVGQVGAQSFRHGNTGDPDYEITKLVLYLSREQEAPNSDLSVNVGTGINRGGLANSVARIPAAAIKGSAGSSFTRYEISYSTPVGPLTAGTSYYINFENEAANGKAYYLEYAESNTYPRGTYFKNASDDGKDIRFKILGTPVSSSPAR